MKKEIRRRKKLPFMGHEEGAKSVELLNAEVRKDKIKEYTDTV